MVYHRRILHDSKCFIYGVQGIYNTINSVQRSDGVVIWVKLVWFISCFAIQMLLCFTTRSMEVAWTWGTVYVCGYIGVTFIQWCYNDFNCIILWVCCRGWHYSILLPMDLRTARLTLSRCLSGGTMKTEYIEFYFFIGIDSVDSKDLAWDYYEELYDLSLYEGIFQVLILWKSAIHTLPASLMSFAWTLMKSTMTFLMLCIKQNSTITVIRYWFYDVLSCNIC